MDMDSALAEFIRGYFSTRQRSPRTENAYRIDLIQFRTFIGPQEPIDQIGVEHLERWAAILRGKGYAVQSVRRKLAALRAFLGFWVRRGVLQSSPFWRIRLDLGRERRLPRALAGSDAKKLVETAWAKLLFSHAERRRTPSRLFLAQRNIAIIEILFATGMRVGELAALNLGSWNHNDACFVVDGKGSRQRLAILPDSRSTEAMSRYLNARNRLPLEETALILNARGRRITTQGVARIVSQLASEAGIHSRVTPHMLRHTVATLLLRMGADIRVVQEVLGHTSITTTQRYTHVTKEHLRSTLALHHPSHHLDIKVSPQLADSPH